jgi:serine/threonine protein kinase
VWKRLDHSNVLPAYGASLDIAEFCVVSPWMPEGDILHYVTKYPGADRALIVRPHVTHASKYPKFRSPDDRGGRRDFLSSFQQRHSRRLEGGQLFLLSSFHPLKVIHQPNILFDNTGVPKITDFGVSSITVNVHTNNASTPNSGVSMRWTAPEILEPPNSDPVRPTKASDVYAFAMVVIEARHHQRLRRLGFLQPLLDFYRKVSLPRRNGSKRLSHGDEGQTTLQTRWRLEIGPFVWSLESRRGLLEQEAG